MKYRYIYSKTKEIKVLLTEPDYDCIRFLNRICEWKFTADYKLYQYILPPVYTIAVISNILYSYGGKYDFELNEVI